MASISDYKITVNETPLGEVIEKDYTARYNELHPWKYNKPNPLQYYKLVYFRPHNGVYIEKFTINTRVESYHTGDEDHSI